MSARSSWAGLAHCLQAFSECSHHLPMRGDFTVFDGTFTLRDELEHAERIDHLLVAASVEEHPFGLTVLGNDDGVTSLIDLMKHLSRIGLDVGDRRDVGLKGHRIRQYEQHT